jgi:hypothetical protein
MEGSCEHCNELWFHEMFGIAWVAEWLAVCQLELTSSFRMLDYEVELQSRITNEADQQSWYLVAEYITAKQTSN